MINTAYKFNTNHDHGAQSKEKKVSRISPAILAPCALCSRLEHEGRDEIADGVCVCVCVCKGSKINHCNRHTHHGMYGMW